MKSWLEKYIIKMCSTKNEGKSIIAERCIRTLKPTIRTLKHNTYISFGKEINDKNTNDHVRIQKYFQ